MSYLARNQIKRRVAPQGPRLASSNRVHTTSWSDLMLSQFHFCCPTQALSAKASVVLASVPNVAITVFNVIANDHAVRGFPSSRRRITTMAIKEPILTATPTSSGIQDISVERSTEVLLTELDDLVLYSCLDISDIAVTTAVFEVGCATSETGTLDAGTSS